MVEEKRPGGVESPGLAEAIYEGDKERRGELGGSPAVESEDSVGRKVAEAEYGGKDGSRRGNAGVV